MNISSIVRERLGEAWLPTIYAEKVRQLRTRSYRIDVPERENAAAIFYTLLGIELKIGKKRFACPDLATARYLRIFTRLGCREFAIPYDITQIGPIADELEVSWQRGLLLLDENTARESPRARAQFRSAFLRSIRHEIMEIGSGEAMPAFDRSTKQRTDR